MAKVLQIRRGTTAENDAFTGAEGELTVDTEKHTLRVHDGSTEGGTELAHSSDVSNLRALIAEELQKYLPLAGGTMTGNNIYRKGENNALALYAGETQSKGACLALFGGKNSNAGAFHLKASDGTSGCTLIGKANGELAWGGKNVENVESSGTGWIRYTNGLQILYGVTGNGNQYGNITINFPVAFKDDGYGFSSTVIDSNGGVTNNSSRIINKKAAFVTIKSVWVTATGGDISGDRNTYIAIGLWK